MRFPPKVVTVCSETKAGFNYKNNYWCGKSANFWLDMINKINCRKLVIISYIVSQI